MIELGFESSMAAIRGPEGTAVLLTVRRANDPGGARAMMVPRRLVRG